MRYLRFLKPPKLQNDEISALITITSDLGESFLSEESPVRFTLHVADGNILPCPDPQLWRPGLRVLQLRVVITQFRLVKGKWPLQLHVMTGSEPGDGHEPPIFGEYSALGVVAAWSDIVDPTTRTPIVQASNHLQRRFSLANGSALNIWEETGESIARHIWDAGLAFVSYLNETIIQHKEAYGDVEQCRALYHNLSVLELGCGCGLVGISLAQLIPNCKVILTDLPEAQSIAKRNIHAMMPASNSSVSFKCLQWEDEQLPEPFASMLFDLVLVSDCTYNSDSSPWLVSKLATIALSSPGVVVLVAMKVRHESEECFFTLMKDAGFSLQQHTVIALPSPERYVDREFVEIYAFYLGDGGTIPCRNPSKSSYMIHHPRRDQAMKPGASTTLWTADQNDYFPRWAALGMPLTRLWSEEKSKKSMK